MTKKTRTKSISARTASVRKKAASKKNSPAKKKTVTAGKQSPAKESPGKFVISTKDIIRVLELNIRTAQRLLQKTRAVLNKEKNDFVTVREFCRVNKFNEGEFRQRLG